MKQITQKYLIELIKEKQENAKNEYEAIRMGERWTLEEGQILGKERNKAYIDCYQDLMCYLNSVEIVPQEQILPHIKAIVGENYENCFAPNLKVSDKGCVENIEPARNDRFREFIDNGLGKIIGAKQTVDAKSIQFIKFFKGEETYVVEIWCGCGYITNKTFIEEARATAYYNDLVEWWKYWKQN